MSLIPASPGPLYPSRTAPGALKRSCSPVKGPFPKAHRRVHFLEGSVVTGILAGSDGSKADRLATLAMAHQMQTGPVGPAAPPS